MPVSATHSVYLWWQTYAYDKEAFFRDWIVTFQEMSLLGERSLLREPSAISDAGGHLAACYHRMCAHALCCTAVSGSHCLQPHMTCGIVLHCWCTL
jgi:hypothetical protein